MSSLSGVWAASLTPLAADLTPDPSRLLAHVDRLLSDGCDGVVLFGTTGEATSFSVAERLQLLEQVVAGGADPSRIIVGVGCAAPVDTVELTRAASRHGVAAVLMLPPFYYKAVSDEDLAAAFEWIIAAAGPGMAPMLLYNIPQVAGVPVSPELAGRLAADHPGVVVGVKDSSGDPDSLRAFLSAMPGGAVFAGTEMLLIPGLAEGAVGTISAAANVNSHHIRAAFSSRDPADMGVLGAARGVLTSRPIIPALKAVLAERLSDPGWAAVRPPLRPLPVDVGRSLAQSLPAA